VVPESGPKQTAISRLLNFVLGRIGMSAILIDALVFSCIAAFYTGIVIAAANLLGTPPSAQNSAAF
jgi:hypothetical protein